MPLESMMAATNRRRPPQSEHSTHQYAHLGQVAQLRLVAGLEPSAPPHVNVRSTSGKGQEAPAAQRCEMTHEAAQSLTQWSEVCVLTHQNMPFD